MGNFSICVYIEFPNQSGMSLPTETIIHWYYSLSMEKVDFFHGLSLRLIYQNIGILVSGLSYQNQTRVTPRVES